MAKRLEELEREFQTQRAEDTGGFRAVRLEELERRFQSKPGARSAQAESRRYQWRVFLIQTGCTMLAVYLLLTCVIGITVVHGDSMKPTLHEQDIALIWRLSGEYKTGDIVLFHSQASPEILIKRVIAGPGDTVAIDDVTGRVIVNGEVLSEDYIYTGTFSREGNAQPLTLGENEYFVLGDNRQVALDSRSKKVGAVEKGDILGKVVFLVRGSAG